MFNNDLADVVRSNFFSHNVASSCSITNFFSSFLHLMWSPSRTPSFISASKQRRNRTNLRKTTHQIQFPKQCILKFWTMQSKSCQLPFVTSVQRIQSFGSIFLLHWTLECTNDTINSLGRVSSTGLFSYLHHEWGRKSFRWSPSDPLDTNRFRWKSSFSIRERLRVIPLMLDGFHSC